MVHILSYRPQLFIFVKEAAVEVAETLSHFSASLTIIDDDANEENMMLLDLRLGEFF